MSDKEENTKPGTAVLTGKEDPAFDDTVYDLGLNDTHIDIKTPAQKAEDDRMLGEWLREQGDFAEEQRAIKNQNFMSSIKREAAKLAERLSNDEINPGLDFGDEEDRKNQVLFENNLDVARRQLTNRINPNADVVKPANQPHNPGHSLKK